MLKTAGTLPDLDWETAGIAIPCDVEPEALARGFNSRAWRVGNQVVKVTRGSLDASVLLGAMQSEHDVLEQHLGDYMPPTEYRTAKTKDGKSSHVITTQPFIEGVQLPDFLADPSSPTGELRAFLRKCRRVYRETGLMPDIANIQQFWNVLRNSNILMDEAAGPVLVDTTFGKIQRSRTLGSIWNTAIYSGSVLASARLWLDRARPEELSDPSVQTDSF